MGGNPKTPSEAVEYLAQAYEEFGYKAVAMALRTHGPNADKFKVEVRAIELAIEHTRRAMDGGR